MQRQTTEQATMPRGDVETASLRYKEYKELSRSKQLIPLLEVIIKDGGAEDISALRSHLEWVVRQVTNRQEFRSAS